MAPSPTHVRSLYRSLLRELPPRPILRSPRSSLHNHLRESFSSPNTPRATTTTMTTTTNSDSEAARAEQLVAYLRSQRSYIALIERYNPGMNMDEEERIRLTARRVGMDLPLQYTKEKK
ncbi:hypothetical protein ACO1O0_005155 [Amphichorda felina]